MFVLKGRSPAIVVTVLALGAVSAGDAHARDFFVSPTGDDSASGTSTSAPWRTTAKVNAARLEPGDTVSFRGGETFEGLLAPSRSGSASAPIAFASYGGGKATLTDGVWLKSVSHLAFRDLALRGSTKGFSSSPSGSGVDHVSFVRTETRHHAWAYHVHPGDSHWTIRDCVIERIGASGVLSEGSHVRVDGCRISDVGRNSADYAYPHHGIYSKGPFLTAAGNEISGVDGSPEGQGISLRSHGNVVEGNVISDVPFGIGAFAEDPAPATTTIRRNRFRDLAKPALYVGAAEHTPDHFHVYNNTVVASGRAGPAFNWASTRGRTFVFRNNAVQGFGSVIAKGGVTESHNQLGSLGVGADGRPAAGSPLIDGGTASIGSGIALSGSCDGGMLSYCGGAPDIGAVEVR